MDDLQHFLLTRTPALAARYEFLTFPDAAKGRSWLSGMLEKVGTAKAVGSERLDARWITVAFTWNGLRALGVDEASLATFPDEFQQGMAARAEILGTTGANHPDHWLGDLASPDLHAIAILFARDVAERERCKEEHRRFVEQCGVRVLSS
ncbi:MAG TPA: peroxidase, partial [Candidatus Eisenbacteria bacterium]|nr:peroxidase [Candidatus Eisenbacteria bacterium]